jgi:hypothetical protein
MNFQKLVMTITTLTGGAVGLFAPIGFVKWLLRTDPEEAGILTLFFLPVWCLLVVLGLLVGRKAGLRMTGGKRVAQRTLRSDPQQPDRHDGAQRRKAADGPSGCVGDFVVVGAAHQVGIRGCWAPQHGTAPQSPACNHNTGRSCRFHLKVRAMFLAGLSPQGAENQA